MSEKLNNQKQYSDMTFTEFLEEVMDFALTKEQKLLLTMFEELKDKKEDKYHFVPYDSDIKSNKNTIDDGIYRHIGTTITYEGKDYDIQPLLSQLKQRNTINKARIL